MNYDHLFVWNKDRGWKFERGSYMQFDRISNKDVPADHDVMPFSKPLFSIFGERVFLNSGSPEHALLDLKNWIYEQALVEEPNEGDFPDVQDEALKVARTEIVAEYLFGKERIAEYEELLARDPGALAHILSIEPSKACEETLARAQDFAGTIKARIEAERVLRELDQLE